MENLQKFYEKMDKETITRNKKYLEYQKKKLKIGDNLIHAINCLNLSVSYLTEDTEKAQENLAAMNQNLIDISNSILLLNNTLKDK